MVVAPDLSCSNSAASLLARCRPASMIWLT